MRTLKNKLFAAAFAILVISACVKDDKSSWDVRTLTPILSSSLSLNDMLKDSTLKTNPDSSLLLAFEKDLYKASLKDFFVVPDTETVTTLTLQKLELSDRTLTKSVTLATIFPAAVALNGQSVTIPAQNLTSVANVPIDASSFFQTATLKEGFMDVTINNGFPVDIKTLEYKLVDKITNQVLVHDTMKDISSHTSQTKTTKLDGKTVDASMEAQIIALSTYATPGPVLINKNDACDIIITVRGLKPYSATAVFPSQTVYTKDDNAQYDFHGAEIKKMRILSGILRIRIVSTIQEQMYVDYRIPHATLGANNVQQYLTVAPAPKGGVTEVFKDYDLTGYTIDLRGKNPQVDNLFNSFWNTLDVTIDSSGKQTTMSLQDSVYIYYGLLNIKPEWGEGYFGQSDLSSNGTSELDLFSNSSGSIELEDMDVTLKLYNGIGVDATMKINKIESVNTRGGKNVTLTATPLAGTKVIDRATDGPFTPFQTVYKLDKTNSNIKAFIENLPDKLGYDIELRTNPGGNISNWKDFIYDYSEMKATLGVTMPLSLKANNLALADTLNIQSSQGDVFDRVKEGTFNIIVDNSFPLSASVQIYMLNSNGMVTDSMVRNEYNFVQPAPLNTSTGKTDQSVRSIIKVYFTPERMKQLKGSSRLLMKATFNTPTGAAQPTKIYSNYKFDIKLTGDFVYEQRF